MPHIIAFYSPRPGMGKSTAAEAVQRCFFKSHSPRYEASFITSFARPIKMALGAMFNEYRFNSKSVVGGDLPLDKDAPYAADDEYPSDKFPSPRAMTIAIGQALKELDPNIWVKMMKHWINTDSKRRIHTIIDDLRFPAEYEMLRERGAKIIRIWKPGHSIEPTETEALLENYEFDANIINSGTLDEFEQCVVETVRGLKWTEDS